jgi:seryl-tRNA synthetase
MNSRREQVRGFTKTRLRDYLQQKFLDEPTLRGLEDVLTVYAEIEQKQRRISQIETERNQIYRRQQQIQNSLGPIGRDGEEGRLRARYVQQLGEIENQLNAFSQEERNIQTEIEKLEQRALGKLRELTKRSSA